MPGAIRITDDRGRRVPLTPPELLLPGVGDADRRLRLLAATDRPRPAVTRREVRRGLAYGLMALPVFLAVGVAPVLLTSYVRPALWVRFLVMIPLGALPALLTLLIIRRVAPERIATTYLWANLCGSCGYDLAAVEPEADGCRVCPECGAAWRIPPIAATNYARR